MRQRYRLYKRKKGGRYYVHDDVTGKQDSLHTTDRATALRLFHSRGEAQQQPAVNLQIARAYLAASDPQIATRDWQFVMDEMVKLKKDQTQDRWQTAIKDKAFDSIRHLPLLPGLLCPLPRVLVAPVPMNGRYHLVEPVHIRKISGEQVTGIMFHAITLWTPQRFDQARPC